jgi:catechol 2,3-dioxygenase-like lactoylglutathione lyase family enzyme
MDWKIELIAIPVTDVDRAKAFYVDQVGFHADHDHQVTDALRFVQLTPPGSACSIVLGTGITQMPPGSQKGVQCVVADVEAARQQLIANGVQASDVDVEAVGLVCHLQRPRRQHLGTAAIAAVAVECLAAARAPASRKSHEDPLRSPASQARKARIAADADIHPKDADA